MPGIDVVRAWKDDEYRESLPAEIQEALPTAPDNMHELSDEQLTLAAGGLPKVVEDAWRDAWPDDGVWDAMDGPFL